MISYKLDFRWPEFSCLYLDPYMCEWLYEQVSRMVKCAVVYCLKYQYDKAYLREMGDVLPPTLASYINMQFRVRHK